MKTFAVASLIFFIAQIGLGVSLPAGKDESGIRLMKKVYEGGKKQQEPLEWWQETVVYQIYPRSFQDSNGDGTGDLPGILSRIDYFVELGVEAVWFSPIYESPMVDFGYDISNFTNIDPIFGTLEDFKELANALHERGIKVMMDFVPNHSSDLHPWFIKSENREGKYEHYYVWHDAKGFDEEGKPIVPNNWTSIFGGSMWEWSEKRQQFYLHQFVKQQPDLNFEYRPVWNDILAALKFWLDMGVDGFRVDAVPHLFEDQRFLDNPVNENRDPNSKPDEYHYYKPIYTSNLPQVLDFLAEMRMLLDIYTATDDKIRFMMVEAAVDTETLKGYYGTEQRPIAHFPFNFNMLGLKVESTARDVVGVINYWFDNMPEGKWANTIMGNHDNRRIPTRWTTTGADSANMVNILIKGTAISYNGEEIGMEDKWISWEDTVDPGGCNMGPERYEQFSRDPARTPMQWDDTKNAGFSTANKTWLPIHENYVTKNVAAQRVEEESHLKVYKELINLRKRDVWKYGDMATYVLNNDAVMVLTRTTERSVDEMSIVLVANIGNLTQTVDLTPVSEVPDTATVHIRSVGFVNRDITVGSQISTKSIPLGPRNSIVLTFPSP